MGVLEPEIEALAQEIAAQGAQATVAFDADGTLWSGDLGEDLLRELAERKRLVDPAHADTYAHYEHLFATDPPAAFAFCVQAMKGLSVEDVERWSLELFRKKFEARIFPGMRHLLELLQGAGAAISLVSASNAVTIRTAAQAVGLDPQRVLAVEGRVDAQGRLTGEVLPPVTCGGGKVEAIRQKLARPLALACGNSLFDREMLDFARRAVMVAPQGSEGPAVALARSRGWLIHRVRG
ncbi:MAG TPA: HAD-IB family phosphatase [Myxococcales bacterium]|jgi:HAD superfamily phosphoserine phosphatase-like hydrolase